jgi:chromosome transmission fidelity protein 4
LYAHRSDGDRPSGVCYKPYGGWASQPTEWHYNLPSGENAVAVAMSGFAAEDEGLSGTGCAVVATDKGYVRFLSGSGLQKYVWTVSGQVVALAAKNDWAMIVCRGPAGGVDRMWPYLFLGLFLLV